MRKQRGTSFLEFISWVFVAIVAIIVIIYVTKEEQQKIDLAERMATYNIVKVQEMNCAVGGPVDYPFTCIATFHVPKPEVPLYTRHMKLLSEEEARDIP